MPAIDLLAHIAQVLQCFFSRVHIHLVREVRSQGLVIRALCLCVDVGSIVPIWPAAAANPVQEALDEVCHWLRLDGSGEWVGGVPAPMSQAVMAILSNSGLR